MTSEIALLLTQDGIINASIYAVLALSLVLVFTVTRVIFVPQGEFVSYGALTLAMLQQNLFPATVYVLVGMGLIATVYECIGAVRNRHRPSLRLLTLFLVYPGCIWAGAASLPFASLGLGTQILLTLLIVVPLGPMIYRIVFQPLAHTTVLVLLIAAVATHLVLVGIGLLAFGPEGSRTNPLTDWVASAGPLTISGQSLLVMGACLGLMAAFAWIFSASLTGKALRATAINRVGARLVGIRPQLAGQVCLTAAAAVGAVAGVLISPLTTLYYDSGFLIALKGFVAAIIGGLISYPLTVAGALFLGIVEAFASFWASAYREVIVFSLIIPVLLLRSLTSSRRLEEDE